MNLSMIVRVAVKFACSDDSVVLNGSDNNGWRQVMWDNHLVTMPIVSECRAF